MASGTDLPSGTSTPITFSELGKPDDAAISVSALNRAIATTLEHTFKLFWVCGEVSNFTRAASGHWYFSIKDASAQIRCVMFRGRAQYAEFTPREGDHIEVRAWVSMYEPRGEVQLSVEALRRVGQGRLYEAFLRLKAQLEAQGLFDSARKRTVPAYPRAIGVITSLQAAALRDVLTTLARRAAHIPIILYPAPVQGAGAALKLAEMVAIANRRAEVDVLLICRGGGSIEDLWAFNEEVLAHALAESQIPVVSGIGHETDFTIADFAADVRAPTPTAAAELASPQRSALLRELAQQYDALTRAQQRHAERRAQQLDRLARRLISPTQQLARQRELLLRLRTELSRRMHQRLRDSRASLALVCLRRQKTQPDLALKRHELKQRSQRLRMALTRHVEQHRACLSALTAKVVVLSPQRTLERGYAVLLDSRGKAVRAPAELKPASQLTVHLAQGSANVGIASAQTILDSHW